MKFELAKQNSYLKLPLGLTPMPCPDVYISPIGLELEKQKHIFKFFLQFINTPAV